MKSKKRNQGILIVSNEPIPAYNFKKWHGDIKKKLGPNWRKWTVTFHKKYLVFAYPKMTRKKILNYIFIVDYLTKNEDLYLSNHKYQ